MEVAKKAADSKNSVGIEEVGNNKYCYADIFKTPQTTKPTHASDLPATNISVLPILIKAF